MEGPKGKEQGNKKKREAYDEGGSRPLNLSYGMGTPCDVKQVKTRKSYGRKWERQRGKA